MWVRPRPIAIGAALIAMVYIATLYVDEAVPDAIVALVGGKTGVDRVGGMRVRWRTPDGRDEVIDVPGVEEDDVRHAARVMAYGFEMRGVVDGEAMADAATRIGVRPEIDHWRSDEGGPPHTDYYLVGPSPDAIDAMLRDARTAGWVQPPDTRVVYEHVEGMELREPFWRTYLVSTERLLPPEPVASAEFRYDAYSNRPTVLVEFSPAAREAFADATTRYSGRKIATIVDGRVASAPIINGPIRGGRAQITMGGSDPERQERDARTLVSVLNARNLPRGSELEDATYVPPDGPASARIALALLVVIGGALAGALAYALVRLARPRWRTIAPGLAGRAPWLRLAFTFFAPLAVYAGLGITAVGLNDVELSHVVRSGRGAVAADSASVFALGLAPLLAAFVVVELAALLVPPWRALRTRGAAGRRKLGLAVAILAIAFAFVQGLMVANAFAGMSRFGAEVMQMNPTLAHRLVLALTFAAGMFVLVVVAAIVFQRGLGNGYGAILLSLWGFALWDRYADSLAFPLAGAAGAIAIGLVTAIVLHWRIGDDDPAGGDEVPIQLPASGVVPLASAASVVTALAAVAPALAGVLFRLPHWIQLPLAVAWSFAFARPAVFALAARAGIARPRPATWIRATAATIAVLVPIAIIGNHADAIQAMIAAAVIVDLADDWRGRRGDAVPVYPLHQIQHLPLVERTLARAHIRYHASATHLRALLAFFGPWAPVLIYVPSADAARAESLLAAVFDPALPAPNVGDAFA